MYLPMKSILIRSFASGKPSFFLFPYERFIKCFIGRDHDSINRFQLFFIYDAITKWTLTVLKQLLFYKAFHNFTILPFQRNLLTAVNEIEVLYIYDIPILKNS